MTERRITTPIQPELFRAPRLSYVLISEINDANRKIGTILNMLEMHEFSPEEIIKLQVEKRLLRGGINTNLVSLLSLRHGNDLEEDIKVTIDTFPEETIHPFSVNLIQIDAPSPLYPNKTYSMHATLKDLRGSGIVNSIQAKELIGEVPTNTETTMQHLIHTKDELLIIKREIGNTRNEAESAEYTREYLDQLTKDLIIGRIIPLVQNFQIPPEEASISFNRLRDPSGKHYEMTVITIRGKSYYIKTPDAFLKKTIKRELGGYDFAMP